MQSGLFFAAGAFVIWGLFPLYFKLLVTVAPLEVALQRSVWSLLTAMLILLVLRRWAWLGGMLRQPRLMLRYAASAALLWVNSLLYVWAMFEGRVLEASLGYFINPLVSVALGVMVLHERLRRVQWFAVTLAAMGVAWLTWHAGRVPWLALGVALTFGLYGLIRKTAPLGALEGFAMETLLVAPLALPALVWWSYQYNGALMQGDTNLTLLLAMSGPLTTLPLLLFAAAARRLPLATLGLVQYVSPSIQFGLALWVFHEPFNATRLVGFAFIWSALALYSADLLGWTRRGPVAAVGRTAAKP